MIPLNKRQSRIKVAKGKLFAMQIVGTVGDAASVIGIIMSFFGNRFYPIPVRRIGRALQSKWDCCVPLGLLVLLLSMFGCGRGETPEVTKNVNGTVTETVTQLNASQVQSAFESAFSDSLSRMARDPIDDSIVYGIDSLGAVYRFTLPKSPLCSVKVNATREGSHLRFVGTLTPYVKVAVKRDTDLNRKSYEIKFPALMPWSIEADLPPIPIDVLTEDSTTDLAVEFLLWETILAPTETAIVPFDLIRLEPLSESQLAFFLGRDPSPFLSEKGKSHYDHVESSLLSMIPRSNGSFFMINGEDDYIASGDIVEEHNLLDYLMNSVTKRMTFPTETFEVTEVRGGDLQSWMVEGTPDEVQKINGVTYLADVKIGLRGYCRTRTMSFDKSTEGKEIECRQSAWSDWTNIRTLTGRMSITCKNDNTTWKCSIGSRKVNKVPNQSSAGVSALEGSDLVQWTLQPTTIKGFLELIEPDTTELKEQLTGW